MTIQSSGLYWLCWSAVLLFFKMVFLSLYQGYWRLAEKAFHNAEDARVLGLDARPAEHPQVLRAAAAWRNDLESIPLFLILGALYVAVDAEAAQSAALFCTFTAARVLHTFFYLARLQPWRTIVFVVGLVTQIGVCVNIILQLRVS